MPTNFQEYHTFSFFAVEEITYLPRR